MFDLVICQMLLAVIVIDAGDRRTSIYAELVQDPFVLIDLGDCESRTDV